jgi:hypothetical protein
LCYVLLEYLIQFQPKDMLRDEYGVNASGSDDECVQEAFLPEEAGDELA